jgi:predicted dehydrogenase
MTTAEFLRVAIIGCGLIGTEWDRATSTNASALTHAGAFSRNKRARLVALCDQDGARARSAAQYWSVDYFYSDPIKMFAEQNIDVVVISAPSNVRWPLIELAIAARVKVVVIEKPLATSLEESRRIVAAMDLAGVRSIVNYSRNWDPSMRDLRRRIGLGEMGRLQRIVATYGKGISNNGSHLIDLTGYLCGAKPFRARALGTPLDENEAVWSTSGERAWDAQVEFIDAKGFITNLTLLGTDQRAFTCFEIKIIGQKAMFDLSMGGRRLNWIRLQDDPNFESYIVPAPAVPLSSRYLEAMQEMVDEAIKIAKGEITNVSCDAHSALRTAMVVEAIQLSSQDDGRWISLDTLYN